MKELEIKSMLADPNIPDDYKLGGRLDERFLAGVEYAEAAMEKAPELWIARNKDPELWIGGNKINTGIGSISLLVDEPIRNGDIFYNTISKMLYLPDKLFPEITFENSPQKVKLVIK